MKEKRTNNLTLKLVSVALAFLIWLIVVNVSNPDIDMSVTVPIEVKNANVLTSADKTYSLDVKNVRVGYKIRTQYRNRISSDDFNVYVDLEDYSITGAVPVYVEVLNGKSNLIGSITTSPVVVHVDTEDIQRKRFDVENGNFTVETTGGAADGYAIGEVETDADYVYVQGPVSEVGKISSVGIEIDVTEADKNFEGEAEPVFYDANGNIIRDPDPRITLSREKISYRVPVYKIKSLSITASVQGEPAEEYEFNETECSPSFINVYGPDEMLDEHNTVNIPASELDITGATQNVTKSVDIRDYIPDGLTLAEPGSEITIVAKIRKKPTVITNVSEENSDAEVSSEEETGETESEDATKEAASETETEFMESSEASDEGKTGSGNSQKESASESGSEGEPSRQNFSLNNSKTQPTTSAARER